MPFATLTKGKPTPYVNSSTVRCTGCDYTIALYCTWICDTYYILPCSHILCASCFRPIIIYGILERLPSRAFDRFNSRCGHTIPIELVQGGAFNARTVADYERFLERRETAVLLSGREMDREIRETERTRERLVRALEGLAMESKMLEKRLGEVEEKIDELNGWVRVRVPGE